MAGNTTTEAIADTVADLITPISYALADVRAGRLRALGVTTNTRSPLLLEVSTIAEAGVTGFDYPIWYGGVGAGRHSRRSGGQTSEGHRPGSDLP